MKVIICILIVFYKLSAYSHSLPEALSSQYYFEDLLHLDFEKPLALATPPGETSLYVVEKEGRIFEISDLKKPNKKLFFDISSKVDAKGESGLLGLAFHPNYKNNQTFFIFYSTIEAGARYQVLSKINIGSKGKNSLEETQLIKQFDEAGNHNGGDLHFGSDGYLYVSTGDEGKSGDFYKNSQKIDKDFFSSILRIDVDMKETNLWPNPHPAIVKNSKGQSSYKVPLDNPWVKTVEYMEKKLDPVKVRTEFWAIGFRNPWRMSFDKNGDLWVGDVGQGVLEEINILPQGQGGLNFGWAYREGSRAYWEDELKTNLFTEPVYEYGRQGMITTFLGRSVTGGVVNQSGKIPELKDKYIFADYINGNVWSLDSQNENKVEFITNFMNISAFGHHPITGEVLACGLNSGKVKVLKKSQTKPKAIPQMLSETGLFKSMTPLKAGKDLVAYRTNVEAWSDHAAQKKWFLLPKGAMFKYHKTNAWSSPQGALWVQHFELEKERGVPSTSFPVETRILVKTHDGVYGLSYKWNEDQSDAKLVSEYGDTQTLKIQTTGKKHEQSWKFPSRMECMMCHNNISGFNLGMKTHQLNHQSKLDGVDQNFMSWLYNKNYLNQKPTQQDLKRKLHPLDSNASLENKARSYLDVNCALCHQKGGSTPIAIDLRLNLPFKDTKLNRRALLHLGEERRKVIDPGKPENSVILNRMKASDGFTRMPFLGTSVVDQEAVEVIEAWIKSL